METQGIKNIEVEFKFNATISLEEFKVFCEAKNPGKFKIISGFDHFMSKKGDKQSFYRHRVNTNENQLTFKRKTTEDNNFIREEHNIDLPLSVPRDKIEDLCHIHGYKYDFSLFKNCFIYNYDNYTLVFYVVYNENLKELGRFIEIEMSEEFGWNSEKEAYSELVVIEKLCKSIGLTPQTRLNKSLYEMFSKESK